MATVLNVFRALKPRVKVTVLLILGVALTLALWAYGPIERFAYTYQFPDDRTIGGVPFFFNVITNVPFAIVGLIGLRSLGRRPRALVQAFAVLYLGILLTAFGSAYHHLAPSDDRLIFDRLPMTLAFAGVFAVALGDRIEPKLAIRWLGPLVIVAAASAFYWYFSGQLRPYVFVQGYPIIAIPAMLLFYRGRWLDGRHFIAAVLLYGVAKVFEVYDREAFELGHLLSGHSIKHLFAGWATWHLVLMADKHAPTRRT